MSGTALVTAPLPRRAEVVPGRVAAGAAGSAIPTAVLRIAVLVTLTMVTITAVAQSDDLEISLEAASSEIDRRTERLIFNDVEIRQGDLGIRARRAIGSGLSFDDSDWTFSDEVALTASDGARIEADEAVLSFRAHQLVRATLVGSPVRFERASVRVPGQVARGRAARVDYDLESGSVRLSGDAWLCEGNNQITSETIVYDIAAERVLADSSATADGRVRIIITPPSQDDTAPENGCGTAAPEASPKAQDSDLPGEP